MASYDVNMSGFRCSVEGDSPEEVKEDVARAALLFERYGGDMSLMAQHFQLFKATGDLCDELNEKLGGPIIRTPVSELAQNTFNSIDLHIRLT